MATRKKRAKKVEEVVTKVVDENADEKGGFLAEEAYEEWTRSRDEQGTCFAWFVRGWEFRKVANRLAGGPGELMEQAHWAFKAIVMDGKSPQEVFGEVEENARKQASFVGELEQLYARCCVWGEDFQGVYGYLLENAQKHQEQGKKLSSREEAAVKILKDGGDIEAVLQKMGVDPKQVTDRLKSREVELPEILSDREMLAYRFLVKGESPDEVFDAGITRERVEELLLARPLTVEEQSMVVKEDGKQVACAACGETFQPIVARVVYRDLSNAAEQLDLSYFAGDQGGSFTRGCHINFLNKEGLEEPMAFHGPYHTVSPQHFSGPNCLLDARLKFAKERGLKGLAFSYGRAQAQEIADENNREVVQEKERRERIASFNARRDELPGGLGHALKHQQGRRRRNR